MGLARREFLRVSPDDLDGSWRAVKAAVVRGVVAGQFASARLAEDYVAACLAEQGLSVSPDGAVSPPAFAGWASDGRELGSLLDQPVIGAKVAIADGTTAEEALAGAMNRMLTIAQTQVSDAGRQAVSVGIASRPTVGWTRMVSAPCCSRCAILAGKWFRYSAGFLRHPKCSCTHIPAAEDSYGDVRTDPQALVRAGEVRGLSKADEQALSDGADLSQVVNVGRRKRSGMTTTVGTTRRDVPNARLTPEGIYRVAGADRAEALRLLRVHGYLQ